MPVQSGGVSSLIFLVVIGVWAAYFIQYWVRRRDHLATARSVDQFSETMRVLERRSALPTTDLSEPQRQSYAVGPARPARPQVLVKRAVTSPAEAAERERALDAGAPATACPDTWSPATARRNRALVMLGALSTWLVAVPLVALGLLGWAYLAVPVLSMAVAVGWARHSTRTEAATRVRASRTSSRGHDMPSAAVRPRHVATPRPEAAAATSSVEPTTAQPVEAAAQATDAEQTVETPRVRGELYDLREVEASTAREAARAAAAPEPAQPAPPTRPARLLVDEDDIPLTWDPVPVPRPTYTLKARATRPAPTAADLVGDADTEYAAHEDDAAPVRRVAGA